MLPKFILSVVTCICYISQIICAFIKHIMAIPLNVILCVAITYNCLVSLCSTCIYLYILLYTYIFMTHKSVSECDIKYLHVISSRKGITVSINLLSFILFISFLDIIVQILMCILFSLNGYD